MPSPQELGTVLRLNVTYVEVPVTVKDSTRAILVAGLTWRDFRVFENGVYQPLKEFFVDPISALHCVRDRPEPDLGCDGPRERIAWVQSKAR